MAVSAPAREIDLSGFPPGTVTQFHVWVCLRCIFEVFTKQLKLAPRTAYIEVRRHSPDPAELTALKPSRPYFHPDPENPRCPYCNSIKRWHARIETFRMEGGKPTESARRALAKTLPKPEEQFLLLETKSDQRTVFFQWLDALGHTLDLDDESWLNEAARAYLEKKEPKTDWTGIFSKAGSARRSRRLAEGWEVDTNRLYMSPPLFNEVLLVQYLVSRSHKAGGLTYEGRFTLPELIRRMRQDGYVRSMGAGGEDRFETLENLVTHLTGPETAVKQHYLVDRREFLDKVKTIYAHYAT